MLRRSPPCLKPPPAPAREPRVVGHGQRIEQTRGTLDDPGAVVIAAAARYAAAASAARRRASASSAASSAKPAVARPRASCAATSSGVAARNPGAAPGLPKGRSRGRGIPLPQGDDPAQRRYTVAVQRIGNRGRLLDGFPRRRQIAGTGRSSEAVSGLAAALGILDLHRDGLRLVKRSSAAGRSP